MNRLRDVKARLGGIDLGWGPGEFSLGSSDSRAAARAQLNEQNRQRRRIEVIPLTEVLAGARAGAVRLEQNATVRPLARLW